MAAKSLAQKMKLKSGMRAVVLNAPQGYLETLNPLPEGVRLEPAWKEINTGFRSLPRTRRNWPTSFRGLSKRSNRPACNGSPPPRAALSSRPT